MGSVPKGWADRVREAQKPEKSEKKTDKKAASKPKAGSGK